MVSRSETARPLLTPGEVMQLPPDDELVMVAGVPPIRAKKARYYEDARLRERLLPVPENPKAGFTPKPDDWSALKPVAAPVQTGRNVAGAQAARGANGAAKSDDDPANAGLRREPGLEPHKDIAPEPPKSAVNEFDPDIDEPEQEAAANRALVRTMRMTARQVTMDPSDGMEM